MSVLANPQQILVEEDKKVYQSIINFDKEGDYLIRIFVNIKKEPNNVITVTELLKLKDTMKVKYDKEVDILYIRLNDNPVKESDEDKPGLILDYAADGSIVAIEILNASKKLPHPYRVEYEVA